MKGNIALIGFMGTGKSEVSKALAKKLGRECVSIDSLIEKKVGKNIERIFKEDGEEKFRKLESEILREALEKNKNAVIDCGGGIILNEKNVRLLRKNAIVICLTASPEVIIKRISKIKEKRPLLNVPNKCKRIAELLFVREKLYKRTADFIVDTEKFSIEEIVETIVKLLEKPIIIKAPASKSLTNRALIIAALADGISTIRNPSFCEDTKYMIEALRKFGVKISRKGNSLVVHGTNGKIKIVPKGEIFVGNAGTTMRFLTTFATLAKEKVVIAGNERMRQRPIQELLDALTQAGVRLHSKNNNGCPPVVIQPSEFKGGKITINADKSSQYISSLLLCGVHSKKGIEIEVVDELTSKPYVDMTINIMKKFGIKVVNENYRKFKVPSQKYKAKDIFLEGDATNASYFFGLSAITKNKIRVKNLNPKSEQGDVHFVNILKKMGCEINFRDDWIEVQGRDLKGINIDMNSMPDVVPTLAIVALFAKGRTKIFNVPNLRIKETDRINSLAKELKKVGANVKELKDGLIIEPKKLKLKENIEIESYDDHRIAMSFALLTLINPKIKIKNPSCVKKSFPEFWEVLHRVEK